MGWILTGTLLLNLAGLTFFVVQDRYIKKRHRNLMLLIIGCVFLLILQNLGEFQLAGSIYMPSIRIAYSVLGYSLRPVIIILYFGLVDETHRFVPFWVMAGVNAAIYLTAFFSPVTFYYTEYNAFQRGPLARFCHAFSLICLIYLTGLTVKRYRQIRKRNLLFPIVSAAIVVASVILDSVFWFSECPVSILTIAVVAISMFYYIWLHVRFVEEHENALLAEQRIRIMMSQIQPHFLYNTLSTIQALCLTEPEKASNITAKFGAYLRQNLNSLSSPEPIPVRQELEHTKVYVEIERIRFPYIQVEFDIRDEDFKLPALTIQPLVENSIRHGGFGKRGGRIVVSTAKREDWNEVVVRDDGKGFDVEKAGQADQTHVGLRNVRERIEKACGGEMSVASVIGGGTTVTIRIPAGGHAKGDL